jgi:superfamily I DNA/RNA helicase
MRADDDLTGEQRRIVAWEDGPLVVIAGAGTGKTRVIVERVRRLLETKGAPRDAADAAHSTEPAAVDPLALPAEAASADPDDPFAGPLLPEQILVLTYNVKAAKELADRLEKALGPAVRARLAVANFHSFCHRILVESAPDAGLPSMPDVLDGVGQVLLLRDLRPGLPLLYYSGRGNPFLGLDRFVGFINRAKDELVSPDDFDAYVAAERAAFEARYGPYERALERLEALGSFDRGRSDTRGAYASFRATERAAARGDPTADPDFEKVEKIADREARRAVWGTGAAISRNHLTDEQREAAEHLAATYVADGAALEVLRLSELALVYHAYEAERERRGALDFGEQVAAVIRLFRERPNVLRRWQRRFRYILVDEFQDANIAQVELIEVLGRTPDRPDNVMVVGDDDQSIYRFRGASYAAFVEFDRRFSGPPAHDPDGPAPGPPTRLSIVENFRSRPPILVIANRLISRNLLRYLPDKRLAPNRAGDGALAVELITCAGPDDEAAAIVERIRALAGWDPAVGGEPAVPWSSFAVLYRKHKHRDAIVARLREESIPYTVSGGLSLFASPEIRDLEQALRALADPFADVALARTLTAGPWRLDALELLAITRAASRAKRHLLELIREAVGSGEVTLDAVPTTETTETTETTGTTATTARTAATARPTRPAPPPTPGQPPERVLELAPATRAKLRRLLDTLDELVPETPREGPFTILERYIERTGMLLDLLSADTLESKRSVANVASLMRFAADWQREHPTSTLGDFVGYLDAYQSAGGELPTSVELAEDVAGVGLMTLYQAKGLEYDHVFIPHLLEGEWPVRERDWGLFPRELLREAVPVGDLHTEEERRLLYVAITRARETLTLCTHGGPTAAAKNPSPFVAELIDEAGPELVEHDRTATNGAGMAPGTGGEAGEPASGARLRRGRRGRGNQRARADRRPPEPPRTPLRASPPRRRGPLAPRGRGTRRGRGRWRPDRAPRRARTAGGERGRRRRRGPGGRARPAHPADRGRRRGSRGEPARRRPAAGVLLLHPVRHLRALPPALRAPARLPGADRRDRRRVHVREHRPRRLRGLHEGAPRAGRPRGAAADPRGPRAALRGRVEADRLPRRHVRADLPPPDRHPARQLLAGRARHGRHGAPRGARVRAPARPRRRDAPSCGSAASSTGSTACRRAASRCSTTRPASPARRRPSTRASSSRSTPWPAATSWGWARPSGSPSTTPRPRSG